MLCKLRLSEELVVLVLVYRTAHTIILISVLVHRTIISIIYLNGAKKDITTNSRGIRNIDRRYRSRMICKGQSSLITTDRGWFWRLI